MNNKVIKKVFIIGDLFPDSFADNISVTLKKMGFVVDVASSSLYKNVNNSYLRIMGSYLERALPTLEKYFSEKIIRKVIQFEPDLIIATTSEISPQVIENLKKETDSVIVCWFTDSVANLDRQYMLAAPYDILFAKDPYMVDLFNNKLNKSIHYLPEACNPIWHKDENLTESEKIYYGCDIAIAGNMYYYRALILEQLMNYNVKIWGPVFPRWLDSTTKNLFQKKYVAREEKAKAFKGAKINLNTLNPTEIYGVNCRTFEIAGCGGFQILDYKPALKKLFEIDKEVVTFETLKELKDKIAYYLSHEKEREEVAIRSYKRAHREHTYEKRLISLINFVTDYRVTFKDQE